jgi:uncharacterized membrane protein affecting hemolysin expression
VAAVIATAAIVATLILFVVVIELGNRRTLRRQVERDRQTLGKTTP